MLRERVGVSHGRARKKGRRTRGGGGGGRTWYNQEVYELTTLGNVAFAALEQMQLDLPCNRNKSSSSNNNKGEGQGERAAEAHSSALIKRERLVSRS